ncbi:MULTISPECIES: peroxiredoxin [Curtobacterium]|uniref:peroxiredoxin n=1 Tax=Curtobacterium TaxID=2034 RepID=UPI0021C94EC0|nr:MULTISPECIES: peroxiredoxin [Curtobacterium]MCU0115972.1 peroxiredoxin [Curtobacterium flaccumfaciens]UXZ57983.1 peroxiredoxin [Curtobacterium sp. Arg-1]
MTSRDDVIGRRLPTQSFESTSGGLLDLGSNEGAHRVVFVYPRTGDPAESDSPAWAAIPGAKGCTAEACSFRDLRDEFAGIGWDVVGCSTQTTDYQLEAASRLHLPYPLVSDTGLVLRDALGLATFEFEGSVLYRRVTLLIVSGVVVDVLVADDDPSHHVEDVLRAVHQMGGAA